MDEPDTTVDEIPSWDDYQIPGYAHFGEPRAQASYRIPESLQRRLNGLVRYAGDTGDIPGVESKTDVIRVATHHFVTALEKAHNAGDPFPPAETNRRGRGEDRTESWTSVDVYLPVSLRDRIHGATHYVIDHEAIAGVTSINRLVTAALDEYVTSIEAEHHAGKPFTDPRQRLPRGRRPRR